jgi:hypothetical protein
LWVLLIPATILVAPAAVIVVWLISGWRPAMVLTGSVALVNILVLVGFWVLEIASRRIPAIDRESEVRLAFEADNPDVVVCLGWLSGESARKIPSIATLDVE